MSPQERQEIRNLAIIAHVDHGKTTLVDCLLKQSGSFRENQEVPECFLDSNDLERERGITILAKNTVVHWKGVKINIIDTPGHADFGGEVERVLSMADGVLLLVDAFEGPMPQTRFVLSKAFGYHLTPIVVINKVDRPDARPAEVLDEVYDLFIDLDADEEALEFPVIYASAKNGWATLDASGPGTDLVPLFDTILGKIPQPLDDPDLPLQFRVSTLDYSDFVGRIAVGRVHRGKMKRSERVMLVPHDGPQKEVLVRGVYRYKGLVREEAEEVLAGDICAIYGIEDIDIGDSLTALECVEPMPPIAIDRPTLSMTFRVNDSPFAGREGKYLTSRHVKERLYRELRTNIAMTVEQGPSANIFIVSGRGLMHLGILCETMRREGYEFSVGKPKVIFHEEDGQKSEPIEILVIDTPESSVGKVIEFLGKRKAELNRIEVKGRFQHLEFMIPSRGLIGARTKLMNLTQGEAIVHHNFLEYGAYRGEIQGRTAGVLVAMATGPATAYSLDNLKDRGEFFLEPGTQVYEGMIVGEHCKEKDIVVNICREKKLTNVRSSTKETFTRVTSPRLFTLEEALEYIDEDELVELTPKSIRLRKMLLGEKSRKRVGRV